jgi:hypothetical protein
MFSSGNDVHPVDYLASPVFALIDYRLTRFDWLIGRRSTAGEQGGNENGNESRETFHGR